MTNLNDFYKAIAQVSNTNDSTPLKRFLLGLYKGVFDNKNEEATYDLFLELFKKALKNESNVVDESWLEILEPPNIEVYEPVEYCLQVIRFQIAELEKMESDQLSLEDEMFGVESEEGHSWYNFDPFTNFECGIHGLIDSHYKESLSWATLGEIIETGRVYE